MTTGTRQYISRNGTTTDQGGADTDLTITKSSDKVQLVDPGGSGNNLDLIMVDVSETGVTTAFCEIYVQNEADADEQIQVRDGNNSDNVIGVIDQNFGAWFTWDGTGWSGSSSGLN
jgi:hypothetical protein